MKTHHISSLRPTTLGRRREPASISVGSSTGCTSLKFLTRSAEALNVLGNSIPSLRVVEPTTLTPIAEVERGLWRRLSKHPWLVSIVCHAHRAMLGKKQDDPDTASVCRRVEVDRENIMWAEVRWKLGDPLRRELVEMALEATEAEVANMAFVHERAELLDRYDRVEQRMRERNRMAAVGTMASSVAHDIRSPLTVLVSNLGFLSDALENPDGRDIEELRSVVEDNRMAIDLIEGVLDSMRTFVTQGELATPVRVAPVVSSAVRYTRWHFARTGVKLEVEIEGEPMIAGTSGELCQILVNLLSNAAEASPSGSVVRLLAKTSGEQTRIWVADEGPGVGPGRTDLIFEPFHTSKATGMGLGLSIAREMARRHGGDLHVVQHPPSELAPRPVGACFVLWQPLSASGERSFSSAVS